MNDILCVCSSIVFQEKEQNAENTLEDSFFTEGDEHSKGWTKSSCNTNQFQATLFIVCIVYVRLFSKQYTKLGIIHLL